MFPLELADLLSLSLSAVVFLTLSLRTHSGAVSDCNDVIGSLERGTKTWVGRLVNGT